MNKSTSFARGVSSEFKDINYIGQTEKIACSLATDYNETSTYEVGDFVIYKENVYECEIPITQGELFNIGKWRYVCIYIPTSIDSGDYNLLTNKPSINGVVLTGNKTSEDLGLSGSGDLNYIHSQEVPSDTWEITHNLGKFPSISVIDSIGADVVGEYEYVNENKVILRFNATFSGKAYLN